MSLYQRALAAMVLVCGAVLCPTRADIFPIPLPSFNVDVVKEPGGTTTANLGNSGEAYVTQSFAAANDSVSPKGLPDNGLLGAVQLGPYNGNNAFRIFPQQSGPQLGGPGGQGMVLHILAAAGDGYIVLNGNLTPVHATAPL